MRYLLLLVPLAIAGVPTVIAVRTARAGILTTLQDTTAADTIADLTTAPTTVARPTTTGRADRVGIVATEPMNERRDEDQQACRHCCFRETGGSREMRQLGASLASAFAYYP